MVGGGGKRRPGAEGPQGEKAVAEKKGKCGEADVPSDLRTEAESHYRLSLPEDFYHFWRFCEGLDPEQPADSLSASLGLRLVGPYDILAGKHKMKKKSASLNFNLHWRFYYDPPEFQTIIIGDCKTEFHMGYFRDSPDELPVFVGTNEAKKNCIIVQNGDNVFAAVKLFLMKKLKEVTDKKKTSLLKTIDEKLTEAARELGFSLEQRTVKMKQRDKEVVTKTFHGAGLVVPVDKNDVGYRELPETDASLRRICKTIVEAPSDAERLKAFAPVQEMMTYVQFANDECDYGMGLELGMDLFCHGSHKLLKLTWQTEAERTWTSLQHEWEVPLAGVQYFRASV
ncbi:histone PARylation factor 1 isoform X2 [Mesoplodon densirostris]|uniref:histone PARylation factor 1 isoform X2 n=1 Tax=Mesoplodon densirostris TaxID=48708 RepID=UPI0028DAFB1A|nr:histone PARylation factor 1 isoform X2 [Mesoplodon densirostris]